MRSSLHVVALMAVPSKSSRIKGTLWAMYIGDALAMPVHWYYDRSRIFNDFGEHGITKYEGEWCCVLFVAAFFLRGVLLIRLSDFLNSWVFVLDLSFLVHMAAYCSNVNYLAGLKWIYCHSCMYR